MVGGLAPPIPIQTLKKRLIWNVNRLSKNLQSLTTLALLSWWTSFTFYSSVVVPIGTELFDAIHQGVITQQVTHVLNILTGVYLVIQLIEFFVISTGRIQKILWGLIAISVMNLVYLHGMMDAMIEVADLTISDRREFYRGHRLYLWVSTASWLAGAIMIYLRLFSHKNHSVSAS